MKSDLELARDQAMSLSTSDRLLLAEQLWESVVPPLDKETIELAHKRRRELKDGTVQALSLDEMFTRSYQGLS
ncbi:MAG: addiction module protein [Acidobacteriota bacterium]|nr:addiction module protein [Acidobacteriota bacterium]